MNKRKDKGFTIVETVIAIVIISVISLVATSTVFLSRQTARNSQNKILAANLCSNAITIFRSAASESKNVQELYFTFKERLNQSLDYIARDTDDTQAIILLDSSWGQVEDESKCTFICYFSISLSDGTSKIEITVSEGEKEIYSATYSSSLTEGQ